VAGGSQRRYSLDDYFAVEAGSPIRHEYANGSTVRISKIVAVDKRILARVLGRIAKEDLPRVEAMLEEALELSSGAAARRLP